MFGVSNGTLEELVHAVDQSKPIKLYLDDFDPEWKTYYKDLGPKYGNPLDKILK